MLREELIGASLLQDFAFVCAFETQTCDGMKLLCLGDTELANIEERGNCTINFKLVQSFHCLTERNFCCRIYLTLLDNILKDLPYF